MPRQAASPLRLGGPDDLDDLALEVETAELAAELASRAEDLAAGLVPPGVTRALFPHELAARTNFAGIATALADTTEQLTGRLEAGRRRLLDLVTQDLAAHPDVTSAVRRLADLRANGIHQVAGAGDVLDALRTEVEDALATHAMTAAERAHAEAVAQGVAVPPPSTVAPEVFDRIDEAARRLTVGPAADLVANLEREAWIRSSTATSAAHLANDLRSTVAGLSAQPLADYAATAAASVDGMARQGEAARIGEPASVYASELLDRNTCDACWSIDGFEFADTADARDAYPGGTYRLCEGGPRCRGTLVFVWSKEEPATVDAGPNPPGPPPPEAPPPAPAPEPPPPPPLPADLLPPIDDQAIADALADLDRLKAELRGQALAVRDDAAGYFEAGDAFHMARPEARPQIRDEAGRLQRGGNRAQASNYDWYDALHPNERKRLLRRWMPQGDGLWSAPDEIANDLGRVYGHQTEDEALTQWLEQTRRYDAASSLARGKLPPLDAYGGADVNSLVDSPYDLRLVFGNDREAAARHIADVDALEAENLAASSLHVRPGERAPWSMTQDEYVAELSDLEARAGLIEPLSDDPDFGATYRPEDQAVLDRLNELAPPTLDDPDTPLPADRLWHAIQEVARRARLI